LSINYKDALDIITSKISVISHTKEIPILDSVKHICAQDIYAIEDLPKYPISLKDGFGILENERYEVSTGDILREGTIGVVPLEEIHLKKTVIKNQNIKEAAEDIKENELLLSRGDFIRAHSITSLVSQGFKSIRVFESPRVSILSIGDNLCPVEEDAKKCEVYNSNAVSLAARVLEIGANIHHIKQCKNSIKDIIYTLNNLTKQSDFIITTGAMSMHDAMSKAIYFESFDILFHKVKIAPATPSALTYLNDTPMLHLPGLPLSAMLGFEILGVPTLKVIKNENLRSSKSIFVKNKDTFKCKESCTNAIPGHFDGQTFKSAISFGAGMLNVLAKCNGYALIDNKTNIKKDELVEFLFF
jgi:molybdopterin molybdotransferase